MVGAKQIQGYKPKIAQQKWSISDKSSIMKARDSKHDRDCL